MASLGVGDAPALPAVGDDHRDVTLRESSILLRLVTGLVGFGKRADELAQCRQALLRARAAQRSLPLASRLSCDVATAVPDEGKRRIPVLARKVQGGKVWVGAVCRPQLLSDRQEAVDAVGRLDARGREHALPVADGAPAREIR